MRFDRSQAFIIAGSGLGDIGSHFVDSVRQKEGMWDLPIRRLADDRGTMACVSSRDFTQNIVLSLL